MIIKYYVRTTGQRKFNYSPLEYELLIDRNKDPVGSFIRQLEQISAHDAVLLEDDLVLCKDFQKRIEEVISTYPNEVINFFYRPREFFTTHKQLSFCGNQCTYYPKGIAAKIAAQMKIEGKTNPHLQYDVLQNKAMQKLMIPNVVYRPALVQHIDKGSLIQEENVPPRRTIGFVDYLDELGLDYNDDSSKIYTKENIEALKAVLAREMEGEKKNETTKEVYSRRYRRKL